MTTRETIDTTYADLRPSDLVIDKSGQAWPIAEPFTPTPFNPDEATFYLCDPVTKVKMHFMSKPVNDPVKVSRLATQADEAAKLEAEFSETEWQEDPTLVEAGQLPKMFSPSDGVDDGWRIETVREYLGWLNKLRRSEDEW